jgi:hypothetical protein
MNVGGPQPFAYSNIGLQMKKDEKIDRLKRQLGMIPDLKNRRRDCPEFKKWHRDTEVAIERIFGAGTRHLQDFDDISYTFSAFSNRTPDSDFEHRYRQGLTEAAPVLESMIQELIEYDDTNEPTPPDAVQLVQQLCVKFHAVARQLRDRHGKRDTLDVNDEYDVQDLLHAILTIHFDDIRPEEWTPSYAGGSARVDFLLKKEQTVIEVKKTRKGLEAKQLGDELLIDIGRYHAHPDCKTLICFVYDPDGRIANPRGIENDLNRQHEKLQVKVIIAPR